MLDEKRLKKERKVLRGTYQLRVPDGVNFESAKENFEKQFSAIGYDVDEHYIRAGWVKR